MIANLMTYAETAFYFGRSPIFLGAAVAVSIQLLIVLFGRGGGYGKNH